MDELIATYGTTGAQNKGDDKLGMLTDIVQQLRDDFSERDKLYRAVDTVLFQEHRVHIPENYKKSALEVRSPLPQHISNTVTAALSVNPPTVQFDPVAFGDTAQSNSTLREKFFEASWRRQEEESNRRLFRVFMHALVTKGEGILKTVERAKRAWNQYDKEMAAVRKAIEGDEGLRLEDRERLYSAREVELKRAAPYPIATTDVPPDTFYYVKNEDGFTFACEVKAVPFFQTLERYNATLDKDGNVVVGPEARASALPRHEWASLFGSGQGARTERGRARSLTMLEVWDRSEVNYVLYGPGQMKGKKFGNGTIVNTLKHRYGNPVTGTLRGPYFHAQGVTTHSRLPEHAGLGVLFGFLDLFPLLDSLLTIQSNAAYLYGFPAFKETAQQGPSLGGPFGTDGSEEDAARTRIEPGTLYPRDIAPVDMPRSGVDLEKTIASLRQFIELALPSVLQGMVQGDSGYAQTVAAQLARLGWQPIIDNAEFALSQRAGFESWLIERRIKEEVHVWGEQPANYSGGRARQGWLTVGPEDLRGIHRYRVRLQPETPSDRITQIRTHRELLQLRLETWEDAVTQLGGNPDEVEAGWMLYDLKRDEVLQARIKKEALKEVGTLEEEALADANAEAQAGKGGQPQGGVAPPDMDAGRLPGGQPGQQPGLPPNATVMQPGVPGGGMPMQPPQPGGGGAVQIAPPSGMPGGPGR